jgi:hypothetical protein
MIRSGSKVMWRGRGAVRTVASLPRVAVSNVSNTNTNECVSVGVRNVRVITRNFSRFNRKGKGTNGTTAGVAVAHTHSPTAPLPIKQEWTAVKDEASGEIYYWNETTNETTHLGAPNPNLSVNAVTPAPQESGGSGGMMSGLGGMVAQGMAFGTGSAIAHNVIGSVFGGSGDHSGDSGDSGGDSGHDDGGDDGYDI